MVDIQELRRIERERYENARSCGKEGAGTHRNSGDAGRVAALWMEAKKNLQDALDAQMKGAPNE